ncbi:MULTISPECIES: SDR family NAD(P)-dependent oxidoreductase [Streptomyces]|uniref:SDR family NAD(P)-dependent oxidoreductase n=1 Tax=Streptomyces TaxID=1883 RepID=UPI000A3C87F5|nr:MULTISPECIES: SDR family oxidoreductase [Streptomyces]RSS45533.1 SDR family oxidoreductase [Streptomyces sp. WAC05858]WTB03068.1 SDR family oxidoreductase [Streptomyces antimycoticus]
MALRRPAQDALSGNQDSGGCVNAFEKGNPAEGQLAGRIAIVTGAASGIGRETALLFSSRGAQVLAVDLAAEGLESLAEQAEKQGSPLVTHVQDLRAERAAQEVFDVCRARVGVPDVLANIAGKAGDKSADSTTDEDFDFFVSVNLTTTFRMARQAVLHFEEGGSIINTSSAFAVVGVGGSAPYSAAKGAVSSLTRQMAADYGPRNIRVNAVAPGLIETPATAPRIRAGQFDDTVTKARPIPRVGQPRDIAAAFAFLASDDSSFITGVTLPVCGGWSTTRYRA